MFSDVFLSGHWTGIQAKTWVQVQIFFELQISNQVMGWMITITLNDNYSSLKTALVWIMTLS